MLATQRAATRPNAPKPSTGETNQDEDEGVSEQVSTEIFSSYKCVTIDHPGAIKHPGCIAEPSSLSAIRLPKNDYPVFDTLGDELVASGKLSNLQLEGVRYACQKHLEMLPSGVRAGFFIGDGAGVGKGRQISGIVCDNYCRGRTKHVWVSTSTDLHADAVRDLRDLGMQLPVINNCAALDAATKAGGLSKDFQEGVLFLTYSTLVSAGRGGTTRFEQVMKWLGGTAFDGCIIFDECHRAKNFAVGKDAVSTKVATAVLELQRALPQARVVYCSATGVSEVGHMAYLERMGLWGPGSAFADFESFLSSMKSRGMAFLEMLAMELKNEGKYVARGLSGFKCSGFIMMMHYGVGGSPTIFLKDLTMCPVATILRFRTAEFSHVPCKLTSEQIDMYNGAVYLWQTVRRELAAAIELTGGGGQAGGGGSIWRMFWSAQQRFFKLLCVSLKTPTVVEASQKALADGCCVVIGLQSTGEAAVDALKLRPGQQCGWVSATKETLRKFVQSHFPTKRNTKAENLLTLKQSPESAPNGAPAAEAGVDVPECVEKREELLEQVSNLKLPAHFLDELIDKLGGSKQVSEMTGRSTRVERVNGKLVFAVRAASESSDMDSLNIMEKDAFMKGKKLVAILSDAASTGISLHALRGAPNTRRRVHLTIELPWSADKAIQQLGRSHRSNQVTAPLYGLVTTDVGGEARFAAAVARRLQSLGALTRGDRRAASGVDLSEQNFDSPLGRLALRTMYDAVVGGACDLQAGVTLAAICEGVEVKHAGVPELVEPKAAGFTSLSPEETQTLVSALHHSMLHAVDLMGVGGNVPVLDSEDRSSTSGFAKSTKELGDVRRFLNRLLGLPIARQNLLFNYFTATLAACIRSAKAEGRYSEGMSDMPASNITVAQKPETLWTDPHSGLKTLQNSLRIDRGLSYTAAVERLERERRTGDASGFYVSKREIFGRKLVLLATAKPGSSQMFSICRPNTGVSFFDLDKPDLNSRYLPMKPEEAEELWQEIYDGCYEHCIHGQTCPSGSACVQGRRITMVTILSGSIVRVWGVLEQVLQRHEHELNKADRSMRIIRVEMATAANPERPPLVGVRYKHTLLPEVVSMLSQLHASMKAIAAAAGTQTQAPQRLIEQSEKVGGLSTTTAAKSEPVTPMQPKLRVKLFRPPKTLKSFFGAKTASNAVKSEGGACAQASGATAPKKLAAKGTIATEPIKAAGPGASMKRPALQGGKVAANASAASGAVIDLSEDSPLKKKAPKLETVRTDRLQECKTTTGTCVSVAAAQHEAQDAHMATDATATEHETSDCGPGARLSGEKAAVHTEANLPKDNPDTAMKAGAAASHSECIEQRGLEHVAPARSAGAKQPLTEKRQNGPEQKDCHKQKVLGAGRAVKLQLPDSDVGDLEAVIAMGFDRTQSRIALKTCGGDANRAIEFLLNR